MTNRPSGARLDGVTLIRSAALELLVALACAGCGGSVVSTSGDGGSEPDASADAAGGDTGPSCASLEQAYEYQLSQATVCCPFCNTPQCGYAQRGPCCEISTTATSITAYTSAVDAYLAACPVTCPAITCPVEPSGNCVPVDSSDPTSMGTCQ